MSVSTLQIVSLSGLSPRIDVQNLSQEIWIFLRLETLICLFRDRKWPRLD